MKIALAQINYHIGNFEGNFEKMRDYVEKAKNERADLVVFGELSVCGYPPRDFLEFNDFVRRCEESVQKMAVLSNDIAIIVGAPSVNPAPEGKDLVNSAFFLMEGKVHDVIHKALLPTYDIFDEYRYFEPYKNFHTIEFQGKKIALTVCEDLWNVGNENPLYPNCPMDELIGEDPDLIINISASPFDFAHAQDRIDVLKANCTKYELPIFYVNHVGAQTEIVFDGGSLIMNSNGQVYDEMPYFEEAISYYNLEEIESTKDELKTDNVQPKNKTALIHDALVLGVKDYFGKLGFTRAILGLSGGVDSALVLELAVKALGAENVHSVLMPSEFSSDHSIDDAVQLCKNLGSPYDIIPIKSMYSSFLDTLNPHFNGLPFNVTEENLQARIRGVIGILAFDIKYPSNPKITKI